jgi:hypothetical protein
MRDLVEVIEGQQGMLANWEIFRRWITMTIPPCALVLDQVRNVTNPCRNEQKCPTYSDTLFHLNGTTTCTCRFTWYVYLLIGTIGCRFNRTLAWSPAA